MFYCPSQCCCCCCSSSSSSIPLCCCCYCSVQWVYNISFFAFWHLQWNWILLPPLHFSHASLCLPFSTTTFYVKGVPLVQCTLLEIDKFCSALYSIVYFLFYHCFVLIAWKLHKLHGMRIVTLPHFIWGIMPELSLPAAQWSKTA